MQISSHSGGEVALCEPDVRSPLSSVRAIVLAGVHSWGENELERVACRPLIPIMSKPLIGYTLAWLREGGVASASICANSDTARLRRTLADGKSHRLRVDYYEDVMPRGPAGCARDVAVASEADTFLVVEGTMLPSLPLEPLFQAHQRSGAVLTVVVTAVRDASDSGDRFDEPAGIYIFAREAFQYVPATGYQDIKEMLIPKLHAAGQTVLTYTVPRSAARSVTGIASYLSASTHAIGRLVSGDSAGAGYVRVGEARVHSSARVHPDARLIGPVLVEASCTIEADAVVVGPAWIGAGCTIESQAAICRSALWGRCRIGSGAIVDQSVLAEGGRVEAYGVVRNAVVTPVSQPRLRLLHRILRHWQPALAGPPVLEGGARSIPQPELAEAEALCHPDLSSRYRM